MSPLANSSSRSNVSKTRGDNNGCHHAASNGGVGSSHAAATPPAAATGGCGASAADALSSAGGAANCCDTEDTEDLLSPSNGPKVSMKDFELLKVLGTGGKLSGSEQYTLLISSAIKKRSKVVLDKPFFKVLRSIWEWKLAI